MLYSVQNVIILYRFWYFKSQRKRAKQPALNADCNIILNSGEDTRVAIKLKKSQFKLMFC